MAIFSSFDQPGQLCHLSFSSSEAKGGGGDPNYSNLFLGRVLQAFSCHVMLPPSTLGLWIRRRLRLKTPFCHKGKNMSICFFYVLILRLARRRCFYDFFLLTKINPMAEFKSPTFLCAGGTSASYRGKEEPDRFVS